MARHNRAATTATSTAPAGDTPADAPRPWTHWLNGRLGRDLAGYALVALAVAVGLSLVTFDAGDMPGLVWPLNESPDNLLGQAGAQVAAGLFWWLGLAAFAVPLALLAAGSVLLLLDNAEEPAADGSTDAAGSLRPIRRLAASAGAILAFAALLGDAAPTLDGAPAAGGVVGMALHHLMAIAGHAGVARAVAAVAALGLTLLALGDVPRRLVQVLHADATARAEAATAVAIVPPGSASSPDGRMISDDAVELLPSDDAIDLDGENGAGKSRRSIIGRITRALSASKRAAAAETQRIPEHMVLEPEDLLPPPPSPRQPAASRRVPKTVRSERNKPVEPSAEAAATPTPPADHSYMLPPPELLTPARRPDAGTQDSHAHDMATRLQEALAQFKVTAGVVGIERGPTVTLFELELPPGSRIKKLTGLEHDLSMALRVESVRVVAPIPGRGGVGIEIPNSEPEGVMLRELLENGEVNRIAESHMLPFVVGRDSVGRAVVADLADMPHLLIAGTTGSGKSVAANALVLSLLFTQHPDDVKLVIIDPKMVEFAACKDVPHLLLPIVTDNRRAAGVLEYLVEEMERRYKLLERTLCKHVKEYNALTPAERISRGTRRFKPGEPEEELPEKLPCIVALVDELADLMMVAGKEVETSICRLAQKSRAVGIHLVLATQRPSVDVITGLIKANIPSRLAFRVLSGIDSKTILDRPGAERLLGRGDALFLPAGRLDLVRSQGAFVTNSDILKVMRFIKAQRRAEYIELDLPDPDDDEDDAPTRGKGRKKRSPKKRPAARKKTPAQKMPPKPGGDDSPSIFDASIDPDAGRDRLTIRSDRRVG